MSKRFVPEFEVMQGQIEVVVDDCRQQGKTYEALLWCDALRCLEMQQARILELEQQINKQNTIYLEEGL